MTTPDKPSSSRTPLPPAPAPTARDANPWPLSGERRPAVSRWPVRPPSPPVAGARPEAPAPVPEPASNLPSPLRIVPVIVVVGILAILLVTASEAARAGDLAGLVMPLAISAIVLFGFARGWRRRPR